MPYSKYFLRISLAFIVIILLHTLYHRVVLEKFSTTPSYSIPQDLDIHRSIPTKIPSVIWSYWDQGMTKAPQVVKKCIANWKRYCPEWEIRFLDKNSLSKYLDHEAFHISPKLKSYRAKKADIIRLCLLEKYGGVWMDASVFCCQSLNWIYDIQKQQKSTMVVFCADHFTNNKRYPVFENWFIAATKSHPFIRLWRRDFQDYLDMGYRDYIRGVSKTFINLQKIGNPKYLTMHVSAQKLLQLNSNQDFKVSVLNASDSPFYFLNRVNWDRQKFVKSLITPYRGKTSHFNIIKLTGKSRQLTEKILRKRKSSIHTESLLSKYLSL